MSGNPDAIAAACREISAGSLERAKRVIASGYPFDPLNNAGRNYSDLQKTQIYLRDGFIDRYSGDRLVYPGTLRLLSVLMPEEFPFHPNWKTSQCHLAFWQLLPTIDHIVPVSRGGADEESNWVCTSQLRNGAKSNWLIEELGWALHRPGNLSDWDGMMNWFVSYIEDNPQYTNNKYLASWYTTAKRAVVT